MRKFFWLAMLTGAAGVWFWSKTKPPRVVLAGKVVVLTGAAAGIGRAAARAFAAQGARLALVDSSGGELAAFADELRQTYGATVQTYALDLRDEAAHEGLVRDVLAAFGRLDVLVNNAAISTRSLIDDVEPGPELTRAIFETNLIAPVALTRRVLPVMEAQGAGWIVNVSSIAALIRAPTHDIYTASKSGLDGFSDVTRRKAAASGVRVLKVHPGLTFTPAISRGQTYEETDHFAREHGLLQGPTRMRRPEDVAAAIVNAVRYERNESLAVNAGEHFTILLARWLPAAADRVLTGALK
jgi:dehydrogenase/reductase SDR family member 7B